MKTMLQSKESIHAYRHYYLTQAFFKKFPDLRYLTIVKIDETLSRIATMSIKVDVLEGGKDSHK